MDIRHATAADASTWDSFVIANSPGSYLQSWAWGEVLAADGRAIERLMAYDAGQLIGTALVASYPAPFGFSYGYAPYGPIVKQGLPKNKSIQIIESILRTAADGFKFKPTFIRIDPERGPIYTRLGEALPPSPTCAPPKASARREWLRRPSRRSQVGRPVPKSTPGSAVFAPPALAILDVSRSETQILAGMKQKARYNLLRSQKLGVTVASGTSQKDFETFWRLLNTTQERAQFGLHPKRHYEAIMKLFGSNASIITAYYQDQAIAALLVVFFGTRAVYAHGGSLREHQTVMAPYASHWFAIKEAKRRGCLTYDFGGVSGDAQGHWAGFSRFKLGFGAQVVCHNSRRDFVLRPIARRAFYTLRAIRSKLKS